MKLGGLAPNADLIAATVSSPRTFRLSCAAPPSDVAVDAPSLLASVAIVKLNRTPGNAAWAFLARVTRSAICACDWPASMSKSTPMRPDDAQRSRNVLKPASDPHVNVPAAPPVDRTYLRPDDAS